MPSRDDPTEAFLNVVLVYFVSPCPIPIQLPFRVFLTLCVGRDGRRRAVRCGAVRWDGIRTPILKKVGWIFAHPPREEGFLFSSAEVITAATLQLEAADGINDTPFVTVKVTVGGVRLYVHEWTRMGPAACLVLPVMASPFVMLAEVAKRWRSRW